MKKMLQRDDRIFRVNGSYKSDEDKITDEALSMLQSKQINNYS